MSEKAFWRCTPRKLEALYSQYKTINGIEDKNENKTDYIDNIMF